MQKCFAVKYKFQGDKITLKNA